MKEVLEERVVEAVGGFSWPCLGHGLQEVDGTGRVSDEQVKEILWYRNTYKLLTQKRLRPILNADSVCNMLHKGKEGELKMFHIYFQAAIMIQDLKSVSRSQAC